MRKALGGLVVLILCLGATGGASAGLVDCGLAAGVRCLAAAVFSLSKTLPEDDGFRRHIEFAEQELAPGDTKIALEYVVWDNPDPLPWEDIEWMARAGRFDRAIKQARQRASPVERLGGLLAVAAHMLDRNDTASAKKIADEVERELPSIKSNDNDQDAASLPLDAGEIRARLGQTERAARLIGGRGLGSIDTLLAMASKYPAAAGLREQAWREAERFNEPYAWQLLVEDAVNRGDPAEVSRAGARASATIANAIDANHPDPVISLAAALLKAGLSEAAAKLVKQWPQWVNGKDDIRQVNIVMALIPVLAALGWDQDVQAASHGVSNVYDRSQCLSKAAEEYFRLGRNDAGGRLDVEAFALASSAPSGEPKQQWDHEAALHNLALARAGRGEIQGALDVAGALLNEAKIYEVTSYIVQRAIDSGHGPVAGSAIEALEQQATASQNAGLLLQAAKGWYEVGSEENARRILDQVMKMRLVAADAGVAAELTWRIIDNGKAESILATVAKLRVSDPSAIDHLVKIIGPVSPAVAVQLTGRQVDVERRIGELAEIAIRIAEDAK